MIVVFVNCTLYCITVWSYLPFPVVRVGGGKGIEMEPEDYDFLASFEDSYRADWNGQGLVTPVEQDPHYQAISDLLTISQPVRDGRVCFTHSAIAYHMGILTTSVAYETLFNPSLCVTLCPS